MTTYTTIANNDIDQDSPITAPLVEALRDNPIAMAEGASGAPKIATRTEVGERIGAGDIDITVTGYSGAGFFLSVAHSSGSNRTIGINVSDGTFGTTQTLCPSFAGTDQFEGQGYIDFSTGNFWIAWRGAIENGTVTKTGAMTTLRFVGAADLSIGVLVKPDGGQATT